jgi:hypothetical protein
VGARLSVATRRQKAGRVPRAGAGRSAGSGPRGSPRPAR